VTFPYEIIMNEFILALMGGAMIGLAAVFLMATQGAIMGASGIISRSLTRPSPESLWRIYFLLGMLVAPLLVSAFSDSAIEMQITDNTLLLIVAGLLVGIGTVFGNGCTSGHGICGISRFSNRSIIATCVFMITAILTVILINFFRRAI